LETAAGEARVHQARDHVHINGELGQIGVAIILGAPTTS
jgi:hypothetical protein